METNSALENGAPGPGTVKRYCDLARGGWGAFCVECTSVLEEDRPARPQTALTANTGDAFAAMMEEVRRANPEPLAFIQLSHNATHLEAGSGRRCSPAPTDDPACRLMTRDEILKVRDATIRSAVLAQQADFDGVDVKLCHAFFGAELLAESDGAALDALRRAEGVLDRWEQRIGELTPAAVELREATAHLEEAVRAVVSFSDGVEADPARLEVVEARLGELERLERKYGTDCAGLAERRSALEDELAALESEVEGREELELATQKAHEGAAESARRLRASREKLVKKLRRAVEKGLGDLGLERACFEAAIVPNATTGAGGERRLFGADGSEHVEFLLAANPGESPQALRKIASGGEMARIMLALRGALAVTHSTPTLIFDEVDSGVGGRLGPQVGRHLAALGGHHQILCVTHLPAIAALAQRHLRVHKDVEEGRTRTHVAALEGEARVEEVADMIAGGAAHETARAEARRLLQIDAG